MRPANATRPGPRGLVSFDLCSLNQHLAGSLKTAAAKSQAAAKPTTAEPRQTAAPNPA